MQVTIELEHTKATIESGVITATDAIGLCASALMAVGFQPESIKTAVIDLAKEYIEGDLP